MTVLEESMDNISLQSYALNRDPLTLFSSIRGGFSSADAGEIRTLQDLLRTIQPLHLPLYNGSDLQDRRRVGEGASYRVFRSEHRKKSRVVAIKQIKLPADELQHDAFRAQVCCVLKDLEIMHHPPMARHKNILGLLGYGWGLSDHSPLPFLITEYSEFGTLRQFLKTSPPRMASRLEMCGGVASGLHAMHLCGVSHGDLKLENVLIFNGPPRYTGQPSFIAKLSDFGHSCVLSSEQANGTVQSYRGTAGYLAPELYILGSTAVDFRKCDIWALALFLWEVLLGGLRYTELPRIRDLLYTIDSSTLSGLEIEGKDRPFSDEMDRKMASISEDLSRIAIDFVDKELKGLLSDIERAYVKGIFRTSLRTDPASRYGDVSKLPFVHNKHTSLESSQLIEQNVGDGKWGFEAFTPQSIVSIPHMAKAQMIADAKVAALQQSAESDAVSAPALYLALAYATGFGVEPSMGEFKSWTERSAKNGSTAAKLILEVLSDPANVSATILRGLKMTKNGIDDQSHHGSCQFLEQSDDGWTIQSFRSSDKCNPLHFLAISAKLRHTKTPFKDSVIIKRTEFDTISKEKTLQKRYELDRIARHLGHGAIQEKVLKPHYLHAQFPLSLSGSPLSFAIVLGCHETVEALLRCGAEPLEEVSPDPVEDLRGLSPLHIAVSCLRVSTFSCLWSACLSRLSAATLRRRFFEDEKRQEGALLISSMARRSVLERELLHGRERLSAQTHMIQTLKEALASLVSHGPILSNAVARVFCSGVQDVLKLGDLEIADSLLAQISWTDIQDAKKNMEMREEIMEVAVRMACAGVFGMKKSVQLLDLARSMGADLNPDLHILRVLMQQQNESMFLNQLERGIQVNGTDSSGQSPLHHMLTSEFHKFVSVKRLLIRGASVHCTDSEGRTPLHIAAARGLYPETKELLEAGADPCAIDSKGRTPLLGAVLSGDRLLLSEVIAALPARPIDGQEDCGNSPLLLAFGNMSLARPQAQAQRKTILHHAVEKQDVEAIKLLLTHGAPIDLAEEEGNTPLHLAIRSNANDLDRVLMSLDLLLAAGSCVERLNDAGLSVTHIAVTSWSGDPLKRILSSLLSRRENALAIKDSNGRSVLHHAAGISNDVAVRILLQLGASPCSVDSKGATPLHACAEASYDGMKNSPYGRLAKLKKIATMLCDHGADLEAQNVSGHTAIACAVLNGCEPLFSHLYERYSVQPQDRKALETFSSVWRVAIQEEHWTVLKKLLPLRETFDADMSLLSWPAGARLLKYAVESLDTEILLYFCPLGDDRISNHQLLRRPHTVQSGYQSMVPCPEVLYQKSNNPGYLRRHAQLAGLDPRSVSILLQTAARSRLRHFFPASLTSLRELLVTTNRIKPTVDGSWLPHDSLFFEQYVKEQMTTWQGDVLHGIYIYLASWDPDLLGAYFRLEYRNAAIFFLSIWLDVEDLIQDCASALNWSTNKTQRALAQPVPKIGKFSETDLCRKLSLSAGNNV